MPNKPNLFIIGAMKSGTTSLHNYLDLHSRIAMSREKEPGYFLKDTHSSEEESEYLRLFANKQIYAYCGESSTHYTKLPIHQGVAKRIRAFNPSAKLIYIMRNPLERTISHYWHAVRDIDHGGEPRPILRAIAECPEYLAFSHYAMQLRPYLDLFARDALYTLTFEKLIQDPDAEVNKIFAWLGLGALDVSEHTSEVHNQKPEKIIGVSGNGVLNRIEYSPVWDKASRLVPMSLKQLAKKVAYRRIDGDISEEDLTRLRAAIGSRQRQEVEDLALLLGRGFPEWQQEAATSNG